MGSTTKLTDSDGNVVASYTYGTYGELLSGDATLTRFLYNGEMGVSTDDNGLFYMRQRYYNPEIKRFVNQDILAGTLDNSQSLNRYCYVQGNPVSYVDPFGLSPMDTQDTGNAGLHAVLTAAGFLPVIGGLADLADAVVYLFEGDVAGAIGSGIAIFAGGVALGYKGIKGANAARKAAKAAKAAAKLDDISDTARIARTTTEAISNSSSFMKASSNAADLSQTVKAAKQSSVVDVMKESVTGKGGRALADQATDPYALLKQRGIPQTLTDAEINAAKKFDLQMSGSKSITPGFDNWLNKGTSDNKVYFGMKNGEAKYTGITKQSKDARLYQHNSTGKGFDDLDIQYDGLTRNQARAIEQYFIENGPNELNKTT